MNGIIYSATFSNGRIYVGQTIQDLNAKIAQHKWHAEHFKDSYLFHKAIRKYGFENIIWEILEENISDLDILNQREIFWIEEKNSYNKRNRQGCNMTPGGDERKNLFKYTEEDAYKMVERYKECGNSSIIGKEFGTNSSVILRYVKQLLPNYQEYSYEGKGQKCILSSQEKQDVYDYYVLTGSARLTKERFNIKSQTFNRAMKSIDENYTKYEWNKSIPKLDMPDVIEEFKVMGRLDPIAERYHIHTSTLRNIFIAYGFNDYVDFIQKGKTQKSK